MDPISKPEVKLVASTAAHDAQPASKGTSRTGGKGSRPPPAFFYKSAQWTADGTAVITSSSDDRISTFVLPEDLLEPRDQPLTLRPQHTLALPEPSHVLAPAPYFSLAHPLTQTLLVACRDHPIQLYHALPLPPSSPTPSGSSSSSSPSPSSPSTSSALSTFNFINHQTEAYLTPTALIWPAPGTHFVAGTANLLASFDVTRPGSGPVLRLPTIPSKRHISKGNGVGMRGTVSALACAPPAGPAGGAGVPGLVAAGTWTRWVGLYDLARAGACVATWGVAGASRTPPGATDADADAVVDARHARAAGGTGELGGQGILQTVWSPCGRYLVLNERRSAGLLVYDVRVTGRLLSWLVGRDAMTHQRLTCDVYPGSDGAGGGGFEVWAGTRTGGVQAWDRVGMEEGCVGPAWGWDAHGEGSPVGSAAVHGSGSVVATCSGGWSIPDDDEENEDDGDDGDESSAGSRGDDVGGPSDDDGSSAASSASSVGSQPRRTTLPSPDHSLKIWSINLSSGPESEPLG